MVGVSAVKSSDNISCSFPLVTQGTLDYSEIGKAITLAPSDACSRVSNSRGDFGGPERFIEVPQYKDKYLEHGVWSSQGLLCGFR